MNKRICSTIFAVICFTAAFLIPVRDMRLGAEESSGPPKILHIYGNVTTYPENGKWQALTKDTLMQKDDSKTLTTMEPPKLATATSGSTGKTGTKSSGQSSGSGATQSPSTGGSNFDYQQVRDSIRVPPAYKH